MSVAPFWNLEKGLVTAMRLALAGLVALCSAVSAVAQVSPDRVDPTVAPAPTAAGSKTKNTMPPQDRVSAAFSLGGSYTFDAEMEDGRGDYSVARSGAELTLFIPAGEKLSFTVGVANEWSWYDFSSSGPVGVTSGIEKPFSEVTTVRITPAFIYRVNEKWSVFGGPSIEASGEPDADVDDALLYGGIVGVRYKFSDTLALTGGVAARSSLEDDVMVFPLVGVEWEFAKDWQLAFRGTSLRVTWEATDTLDLSAQVSYEGREYRLSDDAKIPDGIVRDRRVTAGVQAQWTPKPWLTLRGEAGIVMWSELEFDDRDGDGIDTIDADPTGYLGASLTFRF